MIYIVDVCIDRVLARLRGVPVPRALCAGKAILNLILSALEYNEVFVLDAILDAASPHKIL